MNPEFYALVSLGMFFGAFVLGFPRRASNTVMHIKLVFFVLGGLLWLIPPLLSEYMIQWYVAMGCFAMSMVCNLFVKRSSPDE